MLRTFNFDGQVSPPAADVLASHVSQADLGPRAADERHFLVISGPFGPFTARLGASLRRSGARCSRVLLNAGDVVDWGVAHATAYFGPLRGWRDWLEGLILEQGVTDVILYGDSNPYCAKALGVAQNLRLGVYILEQGYFRPFWITLERSGVNANSSLSRDPDDYRRAARIAPDYTERWLPPLTPPAVWRLSFYHLAVWTGAVLFPAYRPPYQYSIFRQAVGHIRRYLRQRLSPGADRSTLAAAVSGEGSLYIVILQRPGDSQMRLHSPFAATADFIGTVVASFARSAPAGSRLLFKSHPLDPGIEPHRDAIDTAADAVGVSDQVFFVDTGDLATLFSQASGAVTVNSTAGLAAVGAGVPTITMGKAIYDMPGLTHQGGLDDFWGTPQAPDLDLFRVYRRVVMARTQINGAYATIRGIEMALPEVTRRLLA